MMSDEKKPSKHESVASLFPGVIEVFDDEKKPNATVNDIYDYLRTRLGPDYDIRVLRSPVRPDGIEVIEVCFAGKEPDAKKWYVALAPCPMADMTRVLDRCLEERCLEELKR